ncbi:hypothetical protein GCM10020370_27420 [Paenibacillus hodogayensis]
MLTRFTDRRRTRLLPLLVAFMLILGVFPAGYNTAFASIEYPVFSPSYPTLTSTSLTTATLKVKSPQNGTVYYVVTDEMMSLMLSSLSVKNGMGLGNVPITNKGSIPVQAGVEVQLPISGLSSMPGMPMLTSTISVVIEDPHGTLLQVPLRFPFQPLIDTTPPVFEGGFPQIGSVTPDSVEVKVKLDEPAIVYTKVLPRGSAPIDSITVASNLPGTPFITANTEQTITISGLTPNTDYDIYVVARDIPSMYSPIGNLQTSPVMLQTSTTTAGPSAPAQVTAVGGDAQAVVTWSSSAQAVSYAVYKYAGTAAPLLESDWTVVQPGTADTSFTVTGLTNGTPYVFAVKASDGAQSSAFSSASASVTPRAVLAPPAQVSATAGDSLAAVTWSASANAVSYAVYHYAGAAAPLLPSDWVVSAPTVTGTTYTVQNLVNGTPYVFAVKAIDGDGTSAFSPASASVTPVAALTPPTVPQEVLAVAGNAQASLSWNASNHANSYAVYQYAGTAAPQQESDWVLAASNVIGKRYTVTGLTNGTSYVFAVRAVNEAGWSDFSQASGSVTPVAALTPPTVPQEVVAVAGNAQVSLSWNASRNVVSYSVYQYAGTAAPQQTSDWVLAASNVTGKSFTVTGLTNGTAYVFAVRASNEAGTSDYSLPSASVIPQGGSDNPGTNPGTEPETNPGTNSGANSGGGAGGSAPTTETIKVNVENGTNAAVVSSLDITRTRDAKGSIKDSLKFESGKAKEIVQQLIDSGSKIATIVIPDAKDEVSEWNFTIDKATSSLLFEKGIDLVLVNNNVKITIPSAALQDRAQDVYFRLVPLKSQQERSDVERRAQADTGIVTVAGDARIHMAGRPVVIETNLQDRPVTLVLPLEGQAALNADPSQLGVYIEHSDGSKELVRGEVVDLAEKGEKGLRITVDKFSTFSVVLVDAWGGSKELKAYIQGYEDHTFRPNGFITRAETAAIIARIAGDKAASASVSYTDVSAGHWAATAIATATNLTIMTGYEDKSFKPNQAVTRAEMAKALLPLLKTDRGAASVSFSDMKGHWAADAVARLKAAGVLNGYEDGTFRPDGQLTRAEAVTMINGILGVAPHKDQQPIWKDVKSDFWAYGAIQAASAAQ